MEETNSIQETAEAESQPQNDPIEAALNEAVSVSMGVEPKAEEAVAEPEAESAPVEQKEGAPKADKAEPVAEKPKEEPTKQENFPKVAHEDAVADDPDDDLGAALKELEDDKDEDGNPNYDPKILKLMRGLYDENRKLKTAGETAARETAFDKQFGSLDEGVRSHVDAAHKSQLRSKFDMLMAGYKATGAEVSQGDVFQEAAKLALGDLMEKASEERKTAALNQRKNLVLARPGGESGHRRGNGPVTEEDIASEIWDQLNK